MESEHIIKVVNVGDPTVNTKVVALKAGEEYIDDACPACYKIGGEKVYAFLSSEIKGRLAKTNTTACTGCIKNKGMELVELSEENKIAYSANYEIKRKQYNKKPIT